MLHILQMRDIKFVTLISNEMKILKDTALVLAESDIQRDIILTVA
jgi:hypothetical protein